jgi:hypothetical protein
LFVGIPPRRVSSDYLPALPQALLVALGMERLEDRRLELGADFLRGLAQDVFEPVLLTAFRLRGKTS